MALNIDMSDPKTQKTVAIFMIPVVLLALFYNFMIKPKIGIIEKKKVEITTLNQKLNRMRSTLQSPGKLNAEKEMLQNKFTELEEFLPGEENVALLLDQLSEIERRTKVYLVEFKATESIEGANKPYRANKYRITIEAGYHQFAEFMSDIMALPRILSFSDLRISTNTEALMGEEMNEGLADQPRNLSIECSLTSYVFKMTGKEEL
ncbi:MAG: type 4a pilus biogenesis protein PilO [Candidatus Latescibacteria bacterium]|nr:type 4a pilus biogenesis protein PilO [Candidatus Latescibacterota bacterium]